MMGRNIFIWVLVVLIASVMAWQFGAQVETRLFALDAETGRVQWSIVPDSNASRVGPLAANANRVLVRVETQEPGRDNYWKLVALETSSGQPLWEFSPDPAQFGGAIAETIPNRPLIVKERVYVAVTVADSQMGGSALTKITILEATTGVLQRIIGPVWLDGLSPFLPIVVADNRLVVVSPENQDNFALQAFDLKTGVLAWQTPLGYGADIFLTALPGPSLVANDQTVFLANSPSVSAFDLATGAQKFTVGDSHSGTVHQIGLVDSALYVCRGDNLTAFDTATGAEQWTYTTPFDHFSFCRFQVDSESVYLTFFYEDLGKTEYGGGWVIALDATQGREQWRTRVFTATYLPNAPTAQQIPAFSPTLLFAIGGSYDQPALIALAQTDGSEQWRFSGGRSQPVTDGSRVFVLARSARWRHWLIW